MPLLATIGRVLFVVLFVFSGASKLFDIASTTQAITDKVALPAMLLPYTAQLEAAGCELLVVGQGRALRFRAGPDHGAALHRCDPVSGALRLADPRADAALGELLRSDHAGRDTVQLEDARAQLTLVRHQGDAETRLFCGPTVSVLIDPRRGLSGRQRMNMMVRRFGLTHAERRALEGIVAGHGIDEMARLHALSPETIRSQVKSLLARTETGSQLELLRLYDRSTR